MNYRLPFLWTLDRDFDYGFGVGCAYWLHRPGVASDKRYVMKGHLGRFSSRAAAVAKLDQVLGQKFKRKIKRYARLWKREGIMGTKHLLRRALERDMMVPADRIDAAIDAVTAELGDLTDRVKFLRALERATAIAKGRDDA